MSETELNKYAEAASELQTVLEEHGIKLYLLITPNKEAIYGDIYLPDKVKHISDKSRADQIVEYLNQNTKCDVVYPKDSLNENADRIQLWRKYDTHWNDIGAFIASQDFLEADGKPTTSIDDVEIVASGHCSGDLAKMLGMGARFNDDISYSIAGYRENINVETAETIDQSNLDFTELASDADNDQTVLFIGDSFLGSMEQFIGSNYSKTIYVHRSNYSSFEKSLIQAEKPDIVVLQTAERFIGNYASCIAHFSETFEEELN